MLRPALIVALGLASSVALGLWMNTSAEPVTSLQPAAAPQNDEKLVRAVVQKYIDARDAEDPQAIAAVFTEDADQLASDGTWRKGRDELVKGMIESSRRDPAKRIIEVTSVRFLAPEVALADGRYIQKGANGAADRLMWAAITLTRGPDGWRIAAIRNMRPTTPAPR